MYNNAKENPAMIVVYTSPGCASCRKVKQWLKDRNLKFVEKNIFSTILNENEIKHLLMRSENGTEDIISKRSKIVQEQNIDFDEMSLNDLVRFIQQNPSILKRPIILNEKSFLVGYDEEEIGAFVPRELRKIAKAACTPECASYEICGKVHEEPDQPKALNQSLLKAV
jgi:regulatory protein spx